MVILALPSYILEASSVAMCVHLLFLLLSASSSCVVAQPTWTETQQPTCIADSARFEARLSNIEQQLQSLNNIEQHLQSLNNIEQQLQSLNNIEQQLQSLNNIEQQLQSLNNIEQQLQNSEF
jgi:predicted PurR-regulated permease PerM